MLLYAPTSLLTTYLQLGQWHVVPSGNVRVANASKGCGHVIVGKKLEPVGKGRPLKFLVLSVVWPRFEAPPHGSTPTHGGGKRRKIVEIWFYMMPLTQKMFNDTTKAEQWCSLEQANGMCCRTIFSIADVINL